MEHLWEKESNQFDAKYIDVLRDESSTLSLEHLRINKKDNKYSIELREHGNKQFALKKWSKSMVLYNESLRYAELGSENVALAYSNRSACFFKMKMYDKTIVDVELAKNSNVPPRVIPKLEAREKECQKLRIAQNERSGSERSFELSYEANKNYPCIANVLEIKHSKEFGRHIIAKCDIPVGKTVLVEEHFLSAKNYEDRICYTCCRYNENFIACPQCPDVMFCNANCMRQNLTHKWECGAFFADFSKHYPVYVLQMRIILLAIEIFGDVTSLMHFVENLLKQDQNVIPSTVHDLRSKFQLFFKLSTSVSNVLGIWEKYANSCQFVYDHVLALPKVSVLFDSEAKKGFLMHFVVHNSLILLTNSIGNEKRISVACVWSLLNHSCAPNLADLLKGEHRYCITIRPVKKGEQIFINYISSSSDLSTEKRQQRLKITKGFDCKCDKCLPTNKPTPPELIRACDEFALQTQNESDAIILERCIFFLNKYGHLPWSSDLEYLTDTYDKQLVKQSLSEHFLEEEEEE